MRDKLAAESGVFCFEMEAAGLMNHFPCLVIPDIYNYSDSHKNEEWQGYAAMTAAAYAKELLCRITPTQIQEQAQLKDLINDVHQVVSETNVHTKNIMVLLDEEKNKVILDWITPLEFGALHRDIAAARQIGTGRWFLDSPEYKT